MPEMKHPKQLDVNEEECVVHWIKQTGYRPAVAEAEVRIIVHCQDGRTYETTTTVELYHDED